MMSKMVSLQAAQDACELMGHRKFYDQVIQDIVHQESHKIADEVDITTLKDYMQVFLDVLTSHRSLVTKILSAHPVSSKKMVVIMIYCVSKLKRV